MEKNTALSAIAVVMLVASAASAEPYQRNLTGRWSQGDMHMTISHINGEATVILPFRSSQTGNVQLSFENEVRATYPEGSFQFSATDRRVEFICPDDSVGAGHAYFGLRGLVIGDFPNREMRLSTCVLTIIADCGSPDPEVVNMDCEGTWN